MSARRDRDLLTIVVGAFVVFFVIVAVAACNNTGGGDSYYYPQDHSHGYYDVHHHYHYYPKYDKHSKVYVAPRKGSSGVKVKPAPRFGGGSGFKKSGGFSGSRRK